MDRYFGGLIFRNLMNKVQGQGNDTTTFAVILFIYIRFE